MLSVSTSVRFGFKIFSVSSLVLFISCSSDENQTVLNGQDLIGEWMYVSENIRGNPMEANECRQQETISFLNETDYVSFGLGQLPETPNTPPCDLVRTDAVYRLEGNIISFFTFGDSNLPPNSKAEIEELNETTLVITFVELEGIVIDAPTVVWERVD
ncbi:lipocalin family protein [Flagellimonas sp.]|uniref:lipocalin family protein n=1 Tax=Flagellimonas sp. TaxID=2058762 RepID=UPI003F4A25B4